MVDRKTSEERRSSSVPCLQGSFLEEQTRYFLIGGGKRESCQVTLHWDLCQQDRPLVKQEVVGSGWNWSQIGQELKGKGGGAVQVSLSQFDC